MVLPMMKHTRAAPPGERIKMSLDMRLPHIA